MLPDQVQGQGQQQPRCMQVVFSSYLPQQWCYYTVSQQGIQGVAQESDAQRSRQPQVQQSASVAQRQRGGDANSYAQPAHWQQNRGAGQAGNASMQPQRQLHQQGASIPDRSHSVNVNLTPHPHTSGAGRIEAREPPHKQQRHV